MRRQKTIMVPCAGDGCGRSLLASGPGLAGYDVRTTPPNVRVRYSLSSEYSGTVCCSSCGTYTRFVRNSSEIPDEPARDASSR